ncbi:hypothetical protein [Photobacterium leiognathi]|uniref:hypothetical protein n=1 Tax=Photobacterium leiognathi TaxID=553611 RepID=UPI0027359EA3|nr:hypothetical protein [Photobacterium leiognathi]
MKNWIIKNLTKLRYMTGIVSIALMVISITFICVRGLNWVQISLAVSLVKYK